MCEKVVSASKCKYEVFIGHEVFVGDMSLFHTFDDF